MQEGVDLGNNMSETQIDCPDAEIIAQPETDTASVINFDKLLADPKRF